MKKAFLPVIVLTLAAASNASPFFYDMTISQQLCGGTCADQTPVFQPKVTFQGISQVGTSQYMISALVEGVIHYNPCNCNPCKCDEQIISQMISIPLFSTTVPTEVTIEVGNAVSRIIRSGCKPCSKSFVSSAPLTVTVTTA